MSEPSLKRATALSLLVHMTFFSLMVFMVRNKVPYSITIPSPYIVTLVTPVKKTEPVKRRTGEPAKLVEKIPPAVKTTVKAKGEAKVEAKGVTLETEDTSKKDAEALRQYVTRRLSDIKTKKNEEQYLSDRLSAIRAKRNLKRIARLKQTIAVRARPSEGGPEPTAGQPSVFTDYFQNVRDRIWQEWVFPGIGLTELEAVISITVMKDGTIKLNQMEKSSGNSLFDRSALKAIQRASPLETPPYEMEIGVRFYP